MCIRDRNIKKNGDYSSTNSDDYYFNWWGGNLRGVKDYPIDLGKYQDKLVYSPHDYGPTVYQQPWFEGDYTYKSLMKDCWKDNWFYIQKQDMAFTIALCQQLLEGEGADWTVRVRCSKGTYVRTLCHDLGRALGCGGCMEELLRTKVGRFSLEESHTLSEVQAAMEEGTIQDQIYPVEQVLADYPAVYADSYGDRLLLNGNPLSENLVSPQHKEGWVRMYASCLLYTSDAADE